MGTFHATIEIGHAQAREFHQIEALVDTGATYLLVPRDVLTYLGYQPMESRPFTMADGRIVDYDVGVVSLKINDLAIRVVCVFGDPGSEPLLGVVALESFLLGVDPVGERLVPVTGRLA